MLSSDEEDGDYMSSSHADDEPRKEACNGYSLRHSSQRRRPGRFREPEEIPFYQSRRPHSPTPYNPALTAYVNPITLPLDHPGPSPSMVKYKNRLRELGMTAAEHKTLLANGKGKDIHKSGVNFKPFRSVSEGISNGPTVVHLPLRPGDFDENDGAEFDEHQDNETQAGGAVDAEDQDDVLLTYGSEHLSDNVNSDSEPEDADQTDDEFDDHQDREIQAVRDADAEDRDQVDELSADGSEYLSERVNSNPEPQEPMFTPYWQGDEFAGIDVSCLTSSILILLAPPPPISSLGRKDQVK